MISLSVQLRQALARLTLPVLFVVTFGAMLIGKADTLLINEMRINLDDALGPALSTLAAPFTGLREAAAKVSGLWHLRSDNARLVAEVDRLREWRGVALALARENRELKAQLHWSSSLSAHSITAQVIADGGGPYARAALLAVAPDQPIRRGGIALDANGLVGRVTQVGSRIARVLLITDRDSRIPVMLKESHSRAILAGTDGDRPRLLYWTDAKPIAGEPVVTSGEGGAFPPDLPVGTVHWTAGHVPEVVPAADLDRLNILRIFDFSAGAASPPAAP